MHIFQVIEKGPPPLPSLSLSLSLYLCIDMCVYIYINRYQKRNIRDSSAVPGNHVFFIVKSTSRLNRHWFNLSPRSEEKRRIVATPIHE